MTLTNGKSLTAMIHLPALPGSINYDRQSIRDMCKHGAHEAEVLSAAGFTEILVQNTHDRPSRKSATTPAIAAMAVVTAAIRDSFDGRLGVNVHKNDAAGAISIAYACDASFVRIKVLVGGVMGPEGLIEGVSEEAQVLRQELDPTMEIWADLYELTSWPVAPTSLENLADLAVRFGGADKLIVTSPSVVDSLDAVIAARTTTSVPVLVGGKTNEHNINQALDGSDGVIVGSCLRVDGDTSQGLDEAAINRFVASLG